MKMVWEMSLLFLLLVYGEIRAAPSGGANSISKLLGERQNCVRRDPNAINFFLYNDLGNKTSYLEILLHDKHSLETSGYRAELPLKLLIHGFSEGSVDETFFPYNVKDAYIKDQGHSLSRNVIIVDLDALTRTHEPSKLNDRDHYACYLQAVLNTNLIGERIAAFVQFLIQEQKTNLDLVHIVGDNLGVHIGGYVGNKLFARFGEKISRITAIDTAVPGFRPNLIEQSRPLSSGDAKFVDAINTINQLAFGDFDETIGHADFFVSLFLQPSRAFDFGDTDVGIIPELSLGGPFIDSFASLYFAKSIGRTDMKGSSSGAEAVTFGDNCSASTRGVYFVCFSLTVDSPCKFDESAESSEETPGKSLHKSINSPN